MLELPYYNTFFKTTTPPAVELSQMLADLTPPALNHVFYGSSGSDANDTIARIVRQYWNMEGKTAEEDHHRPQQRLSRQHHGGAPASAA